jgi:hypothetical protein
MPAAPAQDADFDGDSDFDCDGVVGAGDLGHWRDAFITGIQGDADVDMDSDGQDFLCGRGN